MLKTVGAGPVDDTSPVGSWTKPGENKEKNILVKNLFDQKCHKLHNQRWFPFMIKLNYSQFKDIKAEAKFKLIWKPQKL